MSLTLDSAINGILPLALLVTLSGHPILFLEPDLFYVGEWGISYVYSADT